MMITFLLVCKNDFGSVDVYVIDFLQYVVYVIGKTYSMNTALGGVASNCRSV